MTTLVQALEWNMLSREWNLNVSDLALSHQKSKALLAALKTNLPVGLAELKDGISRKLTAFFTTYVKLICGAQWGWAEKPGP